MQQVLKLGTCGIMAQRPKNEFSMADVKVSKVVPKNSSKTDETNLYHLNILEDPASGLVEVSYIRLVWQWVGQTEGKDDNDLMPISDNEGTCKKLNYLSSWIWAGDSTAGNPTTIKPLSSTCYQHKVKPCVQ